MWTAKRVATGWAVLAIWIVAVLVWATRPATDHVPTGIVEGVRTSVVVECGAPLDGSAGPTEPLALLEPPRVFQHLPCEAQHRSNRISLVIDAAVALVAGAVLTSATRKVLRRRAQAAAAANRAEPAAV